MIVLFHSNNIVIDCQNCVSDVIGRPIVGVIQDIAAKNVKTRIAWVENSLRLAVNYELLASCRDSELYYFNPKKSEFIPEELGWIDFKSAFLKINKGVRYASWQVSSCVGSVWSEVINSFQWNDESTNFSYFCSILGFQSLKAGLHTWSLPELVNAEVNTKVSSEISKVEFFKFVRNNYTKKQYWLLLISYMLFQRKILLLPFIKNYFFVKKSIHLNEHLGQQCKPNVINCSVDVIIPTLGRESYIIDTLMDLNTQTLLPKQVIIVEQIAPGNEDFAYKFLETTNWKFEIVHLVIKELGACNARNLAMQYIKSDWTFLADDDIRLLPETLAGVISYLNENEIFSASLSSYKKGETIDEMKRPFFWSEFSSGCSLVKSSFLEGLQFRKCFEFGFGEDTDFGFQLRQRGCSVIYYNKFPVYHLKAPIGGFRTKFMRSWSRDLIKPVPEPTIHLCALMNYNTYQIKGFQLFYTLKDFNRLMIFGLSIIQVKRSLKYAKILSQEFSK